MSGSTPTRRALLLAGMPFGLAVAGLSAVPALRVELAALLGLVPGAAERARRERLLAEAQTVDWRDLVPGADESALPRLRDGSLARGVVAHGGLVDGRTSPSSSGEPDPLSRLLGARSDMTGPARRVADAIGGIGSLKVLQPRGGAVRNDLDGRTLRLAGFVTPIGFHDGRITDFLLVPFVGACIHVPPPPANQIVLVSGVGRHEAIEGILRPVSVIGRMAVAEADTILARVGYRMHDVVVQPYEGGWTG
jgi:hypothetical protein